MRAKIKSLLFGVEVAFVGGMILLGYYQMIQGWFNG